MKRKATADANGRATKKSKKTASKKTTRSITLAPELKFNDVIVNTNSSLTGTIIPLNQMAVGDTALTRDGNKILNKSVQLRLLYQNLDAAVNTYHRLIIVYDRQPNGTNPTINGVTSGPLDSLDPSGLRNVSTVTRFKVLLDKSFEINNTGSAQFMYKEVVEFVKVPADCQLTGFQDGTSGAPINGGLYLMLIGDQTLASGDSASVNGFTRVRFWG